jgi:peptide/nickel transport system permease protein
MSENKAISLDFTETPSKVSELRRIIRVFLNRKITLLGLIIILITLLSAIFAPWVAPYNPYQPDLDSGLQQPSLKHLLGTDNLGRDTLSRIIYGARTSLTVGIVSIGIAASVGMALGLAAGYFGGLTYIIIMRFLDALMAFPMLLMALTIATLLGGGLKNIVIAISISMIAVYGRLMCGQVLAIKEDDFIIAARTLGSKNPRIMIRHVLPNCFPPLIVMVTLMIGTAILSEAGLSFIGIGIDPPGAAWGAMVNDGYRYLLNHPVLSIAPGFAIMLLVFSFNIVGDGIRDALDPKLRNLI